METESQRGAGQERNPLTGLPANRPVSRALEKAASEPETAVCYIDLTDFKPYNEVYGFSAGDRAITGLAALISSELRPLSGSFAGHVGGDDFVCLLSVKDLEAFYSSLNGKFESLRNSLYSPGDLTRGFITGWSREGERERFPLMGLCCAGFSPYERSLGSAGEISRFATYLKDSARKNREPGRSVFLTPGELGAITRPMEEFTADENVSLVKKRTLIEAMGESGYAHYGEFLLKLLESPVEPLLKKSIIYALGRLRYLPASGKLAQICSSENAHLRMRAVEALGNIGGSEQVRTIAELLDDSSPYVAAAAARALGAAGHPDGIKYLEKIPETPGWPAAEAAGARCLLGDKGALPVVRRFLESRNPYMRKKAASSLEMIPSEPSALAVYEAISREKNPGIKRSLTVSFCRLAGKLTDEECRGIAGEIRELHRTSSGGMSVFFLELLGKSRGPGALETLRGVSRSGKKWERVEAVKGLGHLGCGESLFILKKSLKDFSGSVRAAAAAALGRRGGGVALPELRVMLKDTDPGVRREAARGIINIMRREEEP